MKNKSLLLSLWAVLLLSMPTFAANPKPFTLYTCGDATMADQPAVDQTDVRGWAQVLPTFLTTDVQVQNYAKAGASTKSYMADGSWQQVVARLQKGDVVLLQFGHNDAQQGDAAIYASVADYEANLRQMVKEAQKKRAKVILCTPITRRSFNIHTGELVNNHGAYPEAVRRVAEAEELPLIDLTALTMDWLAAAGAEASVQYFGKTQAEEAAQYTEGKIEDTILNEAGAVEVARLAAQALQQQGLKYIAPYIVLKDDAAVKYTSPSVAQ